MLRGIASTLCQFEEADQLVESLLFDARNNVVLPAEYYIGIVEWNGELNKWKRTIEERLRIAYEEFKNS